MSETLTYALTTLDGQPRLQRLAADDDRVCWQCALPALYRLLNNVGGLQASRFVCHAHAERYLPGGIRGEPTPAVPERGEEETDLARELREVRAASREFRRALLRALGVTDPWAVTTWRTTDYEKAIARLSARPEGEDARRWPSADDLFMELSTVADAKDIAANGPNAPRHRRSLHAVTLTMNEILLALAKVQDRDCKCGHSLSEHGHRKGYREGCAATLNGVDQSDGVCECREFAPARVCWCGHTEPEHKKNATCSRCTCINFARTNPNHREIRAASTPTRSERDGE